MAISNAVQRERWVIIYDENGNQSGTVQVFTDPDDGLKGYTSSAVNIRQGAWINSYDQYGVLTATVPA